MEPYQEVWNDSLRFFNHYSSKMPLSEADWEELISMLPKFVARHPDHADFARKMILAVESELEVIDKAMRMTA